MGSNRPRLVLGKDAPTLSQEQVATLDVMFDLVSSGESLEPDRSAWRLTAAGLLPPDSPGNQSAEYQGRRDAIDRAGTNLLQLDSSAIAQLNPAQRLELLGKRVVELTQELLHFDHFEVRYLNHETRQLELVIVHGLTPLKIGERLYASEQGNGICGYVAATGKSYLCTDTRHDRLYQEGLDNARSALTVPLMVHNDIIGVFNIETEREQPFTHEDLRLTEVFARYLAIALNTLNMLVTERCAVRKAARVEALDGVRAGLEQAISLAEQLKEHGGTGDDRRATRRDLTRCLKRCRATMRSEDLDPPTILGVAETRQRELPRALDGRHVLVADDNPHVRAEMEDVLQRAGCRVTLAATGARMIEILREQQNSECVYDVVLSDINLPDGNGYEVFREAKAIREDLPVILMTGFGYDPHHSIVRASQEGLQCFLFKPFQASQLLGEIEKSLGLPPSDWQAPTGAAT